MASPYSTQTISGYNSSPPPDDGTTGSDNEITWAKHKTKLSDPIKTLSEAINTELLTAFGLGFGQDISVQSATFNVVAADQGKIFSVTGTSTVNLLAAATAGAQFPIVIANDGSNTVTIDPNGAETINGSATLTLNPGDAALITCNGTLWRGFVARGTDYLEDNLNISNTALSSYVIPKYLAGLTMSNGTDADHDIDIAAGSAMDSTDAYLLTASALTKQIDAAHAHGSAAGGLFSGGVAADTWYHVFIIRRDSDGAIDAGFDTSVTAANIPAGYTYYRRIGSVLTNGTSNIIAFNQHGDHFEWDTHVEDYSAADTSWPTTPTLQALTVPSGVKVMAMIRVLKQAGWAAKLSSPDISDTTATTTDYNYDSSGISSYLAVLTNTSSQIYVDTAGSTGGVTNKILTNGWIDLRGK